VVNDCSAGLLRVASVQLRPEFGDNAANLDKARACIEEAGREGARLVVLPELTNTGYVFASREEAHGLAEEVPGGPTCVALAALAAELDVHIVIGLAERSGEALFNSSAVIGPAGFVGKFRKVHLWADENLIFEPGDLGFPMFPTPIGRIASMICYDGWFPEGYRSCAVAGADIVCVPTNWVPIPGQLDGRPAMATVLCMAAAHCNSVVVVAADRVGTERGQPFIGQSVIVSHTGWPLAGPASEDQEEILYADVDLAATRRDRSWNAFNNPLRDRRPEAYTPGLAGRG
jgi:N-carbamoylputrescine amidase